MLKHADTGKIQNWLEAINQFNSTPEFGTTRVLFTPDELAARSYVKEEMKKLGLTVTEDAIGNIFGTLEGGDPTLPPVWTGSHIDTVLNAGMFDGMAGVVGGMEAVRLISESGEKPKRNIVVIVFTSEEPTRFGLSCLGSRAMAGSLTLEDAEKLSDKDGKSLAGVLKELGYDPAGFRDVAVPKGSVFASVELHIEQSGRLEEWGLPVGIVKDICAPTNYMAEVKGCQSHAGGTSMEERRDAFMAACEISLALERLARQTTSEYTTATVGKVEAVPGSVNVIPGLVRFSVDIRDISFDSKNRIAALFKEEIARIEKERGVTVTLIPENHDRPTHCDEGIVELLEESCKKRDIPARKIISGAYHDSMFVGEFAPVAMIFVPSKNGISHSPDEWTDFEDIALGVDVLAETLLTLADA